VQAAYVACGEGHCTLGLQALRSFLAQAKLDGGEKPTVHLFVDEGCAARVEELKRRESNLSSAAHLLPYIVENLNVSSPKLNLYKQCAGLRLSLAKLLPDVPKILYLDTDTHIVGPLARLWNVQPSLWAFAENDLHWYTDGRCPPGWHNFLPKRMKGELKQCYPGTAGINSGVMLANLAAWRRLRVDDEVNYWVQSLTTNGTHPNVLLMGDQDILNIMAAVHERENYTFMLPCEMNAIHLNRFMCFYGQGSWENFLRAYGSNWEDSFRSIGTFAAKRNTRQPVVLHSKFNIKYSGEGCWVDLHYRLLEAVNNVSRGIVPPGARSLCDVMGGCDLS